MTRRTLVVVRLVAMVAVALGLAAFRDGRDHARGESQQLVLPDTNAIPPEVVDAGRRVFHGQGTCFACHGPSLEGGPIAPTLRPHQWKDAARGELGAIHFVVTHGVKGTAMVSHPGGISDADAVRVAVYVWAVSHRGAKP